MIPLKEVANSVYGLNGEIGPIQMPLSELQGLRCRYTTYDDIGKVPLDEFVHIMDDKDFKDLEKRRNKNDC